MGRPKSFQCDEVVDRAMDLFREHGYSGVSIDDLVKATGINRYSLYETFGDKRGLFLEVFDRFQSQKLREADQLINQPGPKMPLFRRYLEAIHERGRNKGPVNCLVTVSAVNLANSDPEIADHVIKHFQALQEIFVQALQVARDQGEIGSPLELKVLARAFINAARGVRIISQFEGLDDTVNDIIDATLSFLQPTVAFQNMRSE